MPELVEILRSDRAEWTAFEANLTDAGLPIADLSDSDQAFFVFRDQCRNLGFGGFRLFGEDGLLRSVVVAEGHRGRGVGIAIVLALLARMKRGGVRRVWLLSTNAAGFFATLGFDPMDRRDAPAAISATAQFTGICPTSAALMCRVLAE